MPADARGDDPSDVAARVIAAGVGAILPLRVGTKLPATRHGHRDATRDPAIAAGYAATGWYAIRPEPGVVAVDVDDPSTFASLMAGADVPPTWAVRTPRGGWHLYFRQPAEPLRQGSWQSAGFDLRTERGYLVAPGTPDYATIEGGPETVAPMPPQLAAALHGVIDAGRPVRDAYTGQVRATGGTGRYAGLVAALEARTTRARPAAGGDWRAHCPGPHHANGDRHASMDWREDPGPDGRRLLIVCRSGGCTAGEIVAALGFETADLFERPAGFVLVDDEPRPDPEDELDALFVSARDRVMALDVGETWAVRPWLPSGALVVLTGKVKEAGKSTFAYAMARAVATGEPFMGELVTGGPVVLLTEMHRAALRAALVRAELDSCENVYTVTSSEARIETWPALVERTRRFATTVGALLVVIDTLGAFAGITGDAENDAGAMTEALRPVQALANDGAAVLVVAHARKSGGSATDVVRGSSAISGAADLIVAMARDPERGETVRVLHTLGRFDATPEYAVIELDDTGYSWRHDAAELEHEHAAEALLEAIPVMPATVSRDELRATVHLLDTEALRRFVSSGRVLRIGSGVRGDPYRYGRVR
jgi:AAA domain/Bifunctional DNA primase/polymerase, N-terminal